MLDVLTRTANGDCDCNSCKARRKLEEHISSNYDVKGTAVNGMNLAHAIVHNGKHHINRSNVLESIEALGINSDLVVFDFQEPAAKAKA